MALPSVRANDIDLDFLRYTNTLQIMPMTRSSLGRLTAKTIVSDSVFPGHLVHVQTCTMSDCHFEN